MFAEILQENKVTVRCITYLVFLALLAAMFFSQYRNDVKHDLRQARDGILFEKTRWGGTQNNLLVRPLPGEADYGSVDAEVPEQVMRNMTYRLFRDISNNQFDTYLIGVLPAHKRLNPEEKQKIFEIFKRITGKTAYEVDADFNRMDLDKVMETQNMTEKQARDYLKEDYYKKLADEFAPGNTVTLLFNYEDYMPIRPELSYAEFKELIGEVRHIIGRKTTAYENFSDYGERPLSYEEALSRYETFVNTDGISDAYARLFCDHMGILLGIMPALIAAETVMRSVRQRKRDKKSYLLKEPGLDRVWTRFFSIACVTIIPVLLFAVAAAVELAAGARTLGLSAGWFAFLSYPVVWLLPTILFSAAAGLICTAVTERFAGVLVPFVFWVWSIRCWGASGSEDILYGTNMILRHNTVGEYEIYRASLDGILMNRAFYTAAAFFLVAVLRFLAEKQLKKPVKLFKF